MSEEFVVKKYAIVTDGVVTTTLYTDPGFMEMLAENSVVDVTDNPAAAEIIEGYTYENGVFSAPTV